MADWRCERMGPGCIEMWSFCHIRGTNRPKGSKTGKCILSGAICKFKQTKALGTPLFFGSFFQQESVVFLANRREKRWRVGKIDEWLER